MEHHGALGGGPGECQAGQGALRLGHPILQGALIEGVGGELGQARVHAVLHSQSVGANAQQHQALEQRLGQATLGCLRYQGTSIQPPA